MKPVIHFELRVLVALSGAVAAGCGSSASGGPTRDHGPDLATETARPGASAVAPDRPASVPPEYVRFPGGYFHPSCTHEVKPGERVRDGQIVRADGTRTAFEPCAYPHYDANGVATSSVHRRGYTPDCITLNPPPPCSLGHGGGGPGEVAGAGPGYMTFFSETTSNPTWLQGSWYVSSAPFVNGGEVDYVWNGLISSDGEEVLQPVLGWNWPSYYSGSAANRWAIAAVDYGNNGVTDPNAMGFYSSLVLVNPGDDITGYVFSDGGGWWFIGMEVNGAYATGFWTWSSKAFPFVYGGVLETHLAYECDELPGDGYTYFHDILVHDTGAPTTPSWTNVVNWAPNGVGEPLAHQCNMSASSSSTRGVLSWANQ